MSETFWIVLTVVAVVVGVAVILALIAGFMMGRKISEYWREVDTDQKRMRNQVLRSGSEKKK